MGSMTNDRDYTSSSGTMAIVVIAILAALVLLALSSCSQGIDDSAFVFGDNGSGTAANATPSPQVITDSAVGIWISGLPDSWKAHVSYKVRDAEGKRVSLVVSGKTAQAARRLVHKLCPQMAQVLPLGQATHVEFRRKAHLTVTTLASLRAGGSCHMHGPE
jgi:hypothetical protein